MAAAELVSPLETNGYPKYELRGRATAWHYDTALQNLTFEEELQVKLLLK
jgi:hypothetical protein